MIRSVFGPIFFRKPAKFEYIGPVGAGIKLLTDNVHKRFLRGFFTESLCGKVTRSEVEIWRYRPFFHNSFIPVFYGRFKSENGKSILEGEFVIHRFTRVFIFAWVIGILLFWGFIMFETHILKKPLEEPLSFTLIPLGMVAFAILLLHMGWFIGKYDIPYIETTIQEIFLKGSI